MATRLASFWITVGGPSRCWTIWAKGTGMSPRIGLQRETPAAESMKPGSPTPRPRMSESFRSALATAARTPSSRMAATVSGSRRRARIGRISAASGSARRLVTEIESWCIEIFTPTTKAALAFICSRVRGRPRDRTPPACDGASWTSPSSSSSPTMVETVPRLRPERSTISMRETGSKRRMQSSTWKRLSLRTNSPSPVRTSDSVISGIETAVRCEC